MGEIEGVNSDCDLSQSFEECRSIEEEEESNDSNGTNKEKAATALSSVTSSSEGLIADVDTDILPTTTSNGNDRSSSSNSLLALSEIESQESTTSSMAGVAMTPLAVVGALSSLHVRGSAGANGPLPPPRSPSFGNRIFRRTFGRLSSSSSRRSGNNGSSGDQGS